jgi:hypothetical protein
MKTKISKAQVEVWKWKEEASMELANIAPENIIDFIKDKVNNVKTKLIENRGNIYPEETDDFGFVADK